MYDGNNDVVEPSKISSSSDKENQKTTEDDLKLPKLSKSPEKFNNNTSMIESMVNSFIYLDICFCGKISILFENTDNYKHLITGN